MIIRPERAGDEHAIRQVHLSAFETPLEANIVDDLRSDGAAHVPELSLVAEREGQIAGHVMLTNATFKGARFAMLGPIAVRTDRQRQGIGSMLMQSAIAIAKGLDYDAIVLIGHPSYYPRFGFERLSRYGLSTSYDVADEVAMILPLRPLEGLSGQVGYPAAFPQS